MAPFAHRIGIAALERLIAEAIARFMPEKAAEDAAKAADSRHFSIDHQQVSFGGTSQITGELDLADALDLDAAVANRGAEELQARIRRTPWTYAARSPPASSPATSSPSTSTPPTTTTPESTVNQPPPRRPKPRQVVLHVHLSETAITGNGDRVPGAGAGGEPATRSSPPTRSAPGAPTPTPRSS